MNVWDRRDKNDVGDKRGDGLGDDIGLNSSCGYYYNRESIFYNDLYQESSIQSNWRSIVEW